MFPQILTVLTGIGVPILLAAGGYILTKKRERDAELRTEKLEHYKAFVLSLNGILEDEAAPETQRSFSQACNNLNLIAPQEVLQCLREYKEEIRSGNLNRNAERERKLCSNLFQSMRRDLGVNPRDKSQLEITLWSANVKAK